jgi:hypothetical protein
MHLSEARKTAGETFTLSELPYPPEQKKSPDVTASGRK